MFQCLFRWLLITNSETKYNFSFALVCRFADSFFFRAFLSFNILSVVLHAVVDPLDEVAGLGVDTGEPGLGTTVAPANNTWDK